MTNLARALLLVCFVIGCSSPASTATPEPTTPSTQPPESQEPSSPTPTSDAVPCTTDADCQTCSVDTCQCVVQSSGTACPLATTPCFADPCMRQTAVCRAGACTLETTQPATE